MPARSTVLKLPRPVRERLDAFIVEQGFGGYDGLVAWLESEGHRVSWSALQRYGRTLRAELSPDLHRVRVATLKARALVDELRADDGVSLKADAGLALIQERIFEAVLEGAAEGELEALRHAGRTLSDTARAQATVARERRAGLREAADKAAGEAAKRGVSAEGVAAIRAAVEGPPE